MADRKTMVHKNYKSGSAGTVRSKGVAKSYKSGADKGSYVKRKDSINHSSARDRSGIEERSNYARSSNEGKGYGKDSDKKNGGGRIGYGKDNDKKNGGGRTCFSNDSDKRYGSGRTGSGRDSEKRYGSGRTGSGGDSDKRDNDWDSKRENRVSTAENTWRGKADHNKGSYGRSSYAHNKEGFSRAGGAERSGYTRGNDNKNGDGRSSNGNSSDKRNNYVGNSSDKRNNYVGNSSYGDRQKNGMNKTDRAVGNRTGRVRTDRDKTDRDRAENDRQGGDRPRRDSQSRGRTFRSDTNKDGRYDSRENIHSKRDYDTKDTKRKTIGCPIYEKCGGCLGQEEPYDVNLAKKQGQLEELLSEFCVVDPIIGMESPNHYRNKVHAVFDHDRENPICGVYEEGTHKVIPMEDCRIENQKASAIIISIRDLLKSFKIKTFDENSGHGLMRHVLVRTGLQSGEIMVVLVLASLIMPSKNNFVRALLKLHPEITTIIINENYRKTSIILGEKEQIIYGKGFIQDTLCGKIFRILPKSFYQINPVQSEILYKKAISYAELTGAETILDAYCGIGTIGMIASEQAKKVISVELNADAVRDARYNAKKNEITNIDFYAKDAGEFMSQVAEEDSQQIDVVFMDPPRNGSDEKFMEEMIKLNPKKIIYISCNPFTLVRDLEYLCRRGYEAKKIAGVDLLPWTKHVETACLLVRKG